MRVQTLLLALWAAVALAWSAEDREIFALKEDVEKDLGPGKTFYDWLDITQNAGDQDIAKAYRRMSRKLHPDKNPSPDANARWTRLGLVNQVLRGPRRERYDFFLNKGFPKWKGTDYYYSRYRPGLGSVLVFLYLFVSAAQYGLLRLQASRQRQHVEAIIAEAKAAAWPDGLPSGKPRRVTMPNGRPLSVHPTGEVFLVEDDAEYRLDPSEVVFPTWRDTLAFRLPMWVVNKARGVDTTTANGHTLNGTSSEPKKKTPKPARKVGPARRKN